MSYVRQSDHKIIKGEKNLKVINVFINLHLIIQFLITIYAYKLFSISKYFSKMSSSNTDTQHHLMAFF